MAGRATCVTCLLVHASALFPQKGYTNAELRHNGSMRGVFATRGMSAGTVIYEMWKADTFSFQACLQSPRSVLHHLSQELEDTRLLDSTCLAELRACQSGSRFEPWVRLLPGFSHEHPLAWPPSETIWNPLRWFVERDKQALRKILQMITKSGDAAEDVNSQCKLSFDDLLWGLTQFVTRSQHTSWAARALNPGLDMFNHAAKANLAFEPINSSKDEMIGLKLLVSRAVQATDEITMDYFPSLHAATYNLYQFGFLDANVPDSALLDVPLMNGRSIFLGIYVGADLNNVLSQAVDAEVAPNKPEAAKAMQTAASAQLKAMPMEVHGRGSALAIVEKRTLLWLQSTLRKHMRRVRADL